MGKIKKLLSISGLAALVAMVATTAALAQPAPASVYCVNGATTTLPITLTFAGGSRVFGEGTAEAVISNSFDNSTFYLGRTSGGAGPFFFIPDSPTFDPATALAPGYTTNSVSRGACTTGTRAPGIPGSSFMCASGYGAQSNPDYVAGKSATETYLDPALGRHYAFFVQGDLNGVQLAQAAEGSTPAGSFYCRLPEGLKVQPIIGSDGKQMLADTQGYLYDSGYANGETIGHPAYRLSS
jgi:opacity protein-like surface antigen